MSYYLTYRPQKTSELDIGAVRDFFADILKSGKVGHAYLFTGPRGTGKTSSARILAKLVNCEHNSEKIAQGKPLAEPCGECDLCRRIETGSSLSVLEMDAASNRGIDDIRALRERIGLAPAEGTFTVYIIDEVHMLTTEAFNALLKTLEEPPKHAVFALCTTEYHKVPETVRSRCMEVRYPKATTDEVKHSLGKAVVGEKLIISGEALTMLAASVDGSFRDGMKILEQLARGGAEISDDRVAQAVKQTQLYAVDEMLAAVLAKDVKEVVRLLKHLESEAVDFVVYGQRLVEALRLRIRVEAERGSDTVQSLIALTEQVADSMVAMKSAYIVQLPLEIALISWCSGVARASEGEPLATIAQSPASSQAPARAVARPVAKPLKVEAIATKRVIEPTPPIPAKQVVSTKPVTGLTLEVVQQRWNEVLAGVKPFNHSIEGLLRSARPKEVVGGDVVVEVFYSFHKERLEQDKHRSAIEQVMGEMFGGKVRLVLVLGSGKPPVYKATTQQPSGGGDDFAKTVEEAFT